MSECVEFQYFRNDKWHLGKLTVDNTPISKIASFPPGWIKLEAEGFKFDLPVYLIENVLAALKGMRDKQEGLM